MAERTSENLRSAAEAGFGQKSEEVRPDSTAAAPPPLPTRSGLEQLFKDTRAALDLSTTNNFPIGAKDTGYTAGAAGGFTLERPDGTSFGIGGDFKMYTEHPSGPGGTTLGPQRDEEALLYFRFGQQGARVQYIVDRLREVLPWANITTVSWEAKAGVTAPTRVGLSIQNGLHDRVFAGGTVEKHTLATQYPHRDHRHVGPYVSLTGYAGSRMGDSPLTVGIRATGQAAPAGTSNLRTVLEAQLEYKNFYLRIGIGAAIQRSALADFDGAPRDGLYPTGYVSTGYRGSGGSGAEVRIDQNPVGTELGAPALFNDNNTVITLGGRLTFETIMNALRTLKLAEPAGS